MGVTRGEGCGLYLCMHHLIIDRFDPSIWSHQVVITDNQSDYLLQICFVRYLFWWVIRNEFISGSLSEKRRSYLFNSWIDFNHILKEC